VRIAVAIAVVLAARPVHAKGCHEVSDVVGLQRCSRYGVWSRDADVPRVWIEVGYFHQRFAAEPFTLGPVALATTPPALDFSTAVEGFQLRMLGGIGRFAYTGVEMLAGGIDEMPHIDGVQPNDGMYMGMHAIAGAHVERYRIALGGELAAGFRATGFWYCPPDVSCKNTQLSEMQARLELQWRLRVDLFAAPNWSVGFGYGQSLVDANDHVWMIGTTIHARVMDGMW
jgi:hypothetical protein